MVGRGKRGKDLFSSWTLLVLTKLRCAFISSHCINDLSSQRERGNLSLLASRKQLIHENLRRIRERLSPCVTLVAVSKTFPFSDIELAYDGGRGQRDFGENRVQELQAKALEARAKGMDVRWHFLGRLQSNKLGKLLEVPNLFAIHSISSLKHIGLLEKVFPNQERSVSIFLQVKTAKENDKSGFICREELREAVERLKEMEERFPLVGLMTMGAIQEADFEGAATRCFQQLKDYRDRLDPCLKLSMGMSRDFSLALALGSDCVRIGTQIFGKKEDIG